ncbi:MAG: hypothetical protein SVU32_09090 [Candidatus Nanohaloarchaea archaeon]|nr:hypothetical protein [Candidatus Nanohaloarchaea archaeon]
MEAVLLNSRPIKANGYIPVPQDVRDYVGVAGEDSSTFWNYDKDTFYVVLSNISLNGGRYEFVDHSDFYELKDNGDRDVRPPGKLPEELQDQFRYVDPDDRVDQLDDVDLDDGEPVDEPLRENRVFFLASEEMIAEDPQCVYLLSTPQVTELLSDVPFALSRDIAGKGPRPGPTPTDVNAVGEQVADDGFRDRYFAQYEAVSLDVTRDLPTPW